MAKPLQGRLVFVAVALIAGVIAFVVGLEEQTASQTTNAPLSAKRQGPTKESLLADPLTAKLMNEHDLILLLIRDPERSLAELAKLPSGGDTSKTYRYVLPHGHKILIGHKWQPPKLWLASWSKSNCGPWCSYRPLGPHRRQGHA